MSWARYAGSRWCPYSHQAALLAYPSCTKPLLISKSLSAPTAVILYVGDYDQAGVLIDKSIEGSLREFLAGWGGELTFHRLAVNDDQIDSMGLPTRPRKGSDTRSPEVTRAVEAEAIPAPAMRGIVSAALQELIPERVLTVQRLIEKQERNDIYSRLLR